MIDILLPTTDRGALAQAIGAGVVFVALAVAARRNRDILHFVIGLAALTFAWFGLRTLH